MEGEMEVQEILAVLRKWGIHTQGQLAALHREELRTRLGLEAVWLRERANGTATRPLRFDVPLENFKSEQPIIAVALMAEPIRPVSQQFGLFETALRNPHQLYETLARLSALLGSDCVGTPILEETHRPDAFRMEPFAWSLEVGT